MIFFELDQAPALYYPCVMDQGLKLAIDVMGSKRALAAAIGITEQSLGAWKRVPAERCQQVAHVTGLSLHDLRPDIYPPIYRSGVVGNGMTMSVAAK
jgi:DNA-binding transcriptional regulator YdaS (Cro superfamily)